MNLLVVIPNTMDKRDIPKALANGEYFKLRWWHRHEYELAKNDAYLCNGQVVEVRFECLSMDDE